jgi:hypothetical protein
LALENEEPMGKKEKNAFALQHSTNAVAALQKTASGP